MAEEGLFISVNGTGVPDPFGPGYPADIGRELSNPWRDVYAQFWGEHFRKKYFWQPIGYKAAVFPMGTSVKEGRDEVVRQCLLRPKGVKKVMCGWSQGELVISDVWRNEILKKGGRLYEYQDDFVGMIGIGGPSRCPGIANGNILAGIPMPKPQKGIVTGGIAGPNCLRPQETPAHYLSCALDGDIYTCSPTGLMPWFSETKTGKLMRLIFDFILDPGFDDVIAIATKVSEIIGDPVNEIIPLVDAVWNAGNFFFKGMNADHWKYEPFMPALIDWINSRI